MESAVYFRHEAERLRGLLRYLQDPQTRSVISDAIADYERKAALADAAEALAETGPKSSDDAPMAPQAA